MAAGARMAGSSPAATSALAGDARRQGAFTVQDPRFTYRAGWWGRACSPSTGPEHGRHRSPFVAAAAPRARFRRRLAVGRAGGDGPAAGRRSRPPVPRGAAARLRGAARRCRSSGGPLGLADSRTGEVLAWYDFQHRRGRGDRPHRTGRPAKRPSAGGAGRWGTRSGEALCGPLAVDPCQRARTASRDAEIASNAAVVLFGGIETMEGMIGKRASCTSSHTRCGPRARPRADLGGRCPYAVEESLRLEPAAAVIDRYATADARLSDARVARSATSSGSPSPPRTGTRPPSRIPIAYDGRPENARRHLAFASGPHVCPRDAPRAASRRTVAVRSRPSELPDVRPRPGPRRSSARPRLPQAARARRRAGTRAEPDAQSTSGWIIQTFGSQ